MRNHTLLLAVFVVAVGLAVPAIAVGAAPHDDGTYEGTYASFEVVDDGIADYTVQDETLFPSVSVAAGEPVDDVSEIDVDRSPMEVTNHAESRIDLATDDGAEAYTYDNERGHLVVHAAEERTHVQVEVNEITGVTTEGDLALVQAGEQTGSFVIAGQSDGEVGVNDDGEVVADLAEGDRLVFRSHGPVRDAEDEASERLISQGIAAGEAYIHEREGELAVDVIEYRDDVDVEAPQADDGYLEVAVTGVDDGGAVVVEPAADVIDDPDQTEVRVSDVPAEEVDSYGDLIDAAGEEPAYVVDDPTVSAADTAFVVAMEGSEREVIEFDRTSSLLEVPGFGIVAGLVALVVATLAAARTRRR